MASLGATSSAVGTVGASGASVLPELKIEPMRHVIDVVSGPRSSGPVISSVSSSASPYWNQSVSDVIAELVGVRVDRVDGRAGRCERPRLGRAGAGRRDGVAEDGREEQRQAVVAERRIGECRRQVGRQPVRCGDRVDGADVDLGVGPVEVVVGHATEGVRPLGGDARPDRRLPAELVLAKPCEALNGHVRLLLKGECVVPSRRWTWRRASVYVAAKPSRTIRVP